MKVDGILKELCDRQNENDIDDDDVGDKSFF